jgi:hypothetical protein
MLGLAVPSQQEATDVRVRLADPSLAGRATALVLASQARAWAAIVHRRRVGIDLHRRSRTVEARDAGDRSAVSVPRGDDSNSKLDAAASARVRPAQPESLRGHDLLIGEERLGSRKTTPRWTNAQQQTSDHSEDAPHETSALTPVRTLGL